MKFAELLDKLQTHYGDEAANARHEIFFLSQHQFPRLRAAFAALRDAALCWHLPTRSSPIPPVLAVVTLAGANGWGCLSPLLATLTQRGIAHATLIHPRLQNALKGQLPCRPTATAWRHALAAFSTTFAGSANAVAPAWVVRCCIFRLRLWRGAWARFLYETNKGGVLLLHNDFDVYSVAAIEAGKQRWRSVCVQHGLPTDEFFPTRADRHILWGESSAVAYAERGTPSATLCFGPGRRIERPAKPHRTPQSIRLISQTHTPIFGRSLKDQFLKLAQELDAYYAGRLKIEILLHPEEARRGHPYTSPPLAALCRMPPHALLSDPIQAAVVVGFCSTALLDAASRGHYVIGVHWPVSASPEALAVGSPAHTVSDVASLFALIETLLHEPDARERFLTRQYAWLIRTFAAENDWPALSGVCE